LKDLAWDRVKGRLETGSGLFASSDGVASDEDGEGGEGDQGKELRGDKGVRDPGEETGEYKLRRT
jgi:hypothetical protein